MPKMTFTDTAISRAPFRDKTTFYTDEDAKGHCRYPGLRLAIGKTSKVFYVVSGRGNVSRSQRLGPFSKSYGVTQAWADAQEARHAGIKTKAERMAEAEAEWARSQSAPTLRDATDQFLAYRSVDRRRRAMSDETRGKYLRVVEAGALSRWQDLPIDALPVVAISRHLDTLQATMPHAAQYAHTVAGAVLRYQSKLLRRDFPIPTLTENTPTSDRKVTRDRHGKPKLDVTVPWSDRMAEIEAEQNPSIRACWLLGWFTGIHQRALGTMRWTDVSLDTRTLAIGYDKGADPRVVALSDRALELIDVLPRHGEFVLWTPKAPRIFIPMDRLPLTCPGDMRHLFNEAAMSIGCPYHVQKWLIGHSLKGAVGMIGHYGRPDLDAQREWANKIADYIDKRAGTITSNLVEHPYRGVARRAGNN